MQFAKVYAHMALLSTLNTQSSSLAGSSAVSAAPAPSLYLLLSFTKVVKSSNDRSPEYTLTSPPLPSTHAIVGNPDTCTHYVAPDVLDDTRGGKQAQKG